MCVQILGKLFPDARGALQKIHSELQSTLERVTAKEKYLSTTFAHLVSNRASHTHTMLAFRARASSGGGVGADACLCAPRATSTRL